MIDCRLIFHCIGFWFDCRNDELLKQEWRAQCKIQFTKNFQNYTWQSKDGLLDLILSMIGSWNQFDDWNGGSLSIKKIVYWDKFRNACWRDGFESHWQIGSRKFTSFMVWVRPAENISKTSWQIWDYKLYLEC